MTESSTEVQGRSRAHESKGPGFAAVVLLNCVRERFGQRPEDHLRATRDGADSHQHEPDQLDLAGTGEPFTAEWRTSGDEHIVGLHGLLEVSRDHYILVIFLYGHSPDSSCEVVTALPEAIESIEGAYLTPARDGTWTYPWTGRSWRRWRATAFSRDSTPRAASMPLHGAAFALGTRAP